MAAPSVRMATAMMKTAFRFESFIPRLLQGEGPPFIFFSLTLNVARSVENRGAIVLNVYSVVETSMGFRSHFRTANAKIPAAPICKSHGLPSSLLVCLGTQHASAAVFLVLTLISSVDRLAIVQYKGAEWKSQ